jgi:argininosuccinate lyase
MAMLANHVRRSAKHLVSQRIRGARPTTMFARSASGQSEKLWGGRFEKDTNETVVPWAESLTCDEEMVVEDLWGSIAHVTMLGRQGIVPANDAAHIINTLVGFQDDMIEGRMDFKDPKFSNHDDVHMNMEARLIAATSMEVGGQMHTTRSRNDQVPVSSQMRCRTRLLELRHKVIAAVEAFMKRADGPGMREAVMPGYTHYQHAQPISVAFWMSQYAAVLTRDLQRLKAAYDCVDRNPLGGGALAGTSFPTDRMLTTELLGFQKVATHSLDATGNRDWMCEVLNTNATLHTTWSRLAGELITWSSYEYRTVTMDDGFAMGSSMMPQKKNPGPCELLRGRQGIMNGYAMGGLTMLHGLPSGYNRDFHEEKELVFASCSMANRAASIIPSLVETTNFNLERMKDLCDKNFMTATELANYLVTDHNVPFRATHHIVGSLVGQLTRAGDNLTNTKAVMEHLKKEGINAVEKDVRRVLDPTSVMLSYNSLGGTGPEAMAGISAEIHADLNKHRAELANDQKRIDTAFAAARSIAKAAGEKGKNVKTVEDLTKLIQQYRPGPIE